MRWFRALIWIGMISVGGYIVVSSFYFSPAGIWPDHDPTSAHRPDEISFWNSGNLPALEFLFTMFYVLVLINTSNNEMNSQRNLFLNNLLRFNIPLAVSAGIADIVDNYVFDFDLPKYYLLSWIVSVLAISLLMRLVQYVRDVKRPLPAGSTKG